MDNKITVVVCSRESDDEKKLFLEHLKDTCGYNVHVMFLVNKDGISLSKIYSEMIKKIETDIIVFIHDDIEFLKKGWGGEIVSLFENNKDYGIIGIAGSSEFNNNGAWWTNKKIYGQLLHRNEGKTWLTAYSNLLDKGKLKEVCVVDGVLIAVNKNRISKNFDIDFNGFHHYDTSFCISNYIDGKCKIGVTTDIRIAHNSIGMLNQSWHDNLIKLNSKFDKYFPLDTEADKDRREKDNTLKENNK